MIDSKPYLERALRLATLKNDVRAQCTVSQKFKCVICHKPLLEFNDLSNVSKMGQDIMIDDTIEVESSNMSIGTNLILKYLGKSLYKGIQVDYLIPKTLMKDAPRFNILETNVNKVLLHSHCHKIKTKVDQTYLFKS